VKPYWEGVGVRLYHGDCREVLPELEEKGIVLTDPPYSEHTHSNSRAGARALHGGSGSKGSPANISRSRHFGFEALGGSLRRFCAREFARLASRWALIFSDVESCTWWRMSIEAAGLEYVRTGAWHKIGATPQFTGDRPGVAFETITIAHARGAKGKPVKKRWTGGGTHAHWSAPIVLERGGSQNEPRLNETQKPEDLILKLIDLFSEPGELLIDPFSGAATTGVCALRRGRRALLVERREEQCERAAERLEAEIACVGYHAAKRGQVGLFAGLT